jgi:hypothetical protein
MRTVPGSNKPARISLRNFCSVSAIRASCIAIHDWAFDERSRFGVDWELFASFASGRLNPRMLVHPSKSNERRLSMANLPLRQSPTNRPLLQIKFRILISIFSKAAHESRPRSATPPPCADNHVRGRTSGSHRVPEGAKTWD